MLHLAGRAEFEQTRVAAHLAQLEQRIQNGDLRFGQTLGVQRVTHGFFHAQTDGFVQVRLLALQGHGHQGFDLGRQLAGHHVFGPPQHEGRDALAQLVHFVAVALALNGVAKQLTEALLAAQKTGHQEVKQAPQLAQVVFHGRARQAQAVCDRDVAHSLRGMRVGVLDVLCFVQHQQMPVGTQPQLAVTVQQRVRREDNVKTAQVLGGFMA